MAGAPLADREQQRWDDAGAKSAAIRDAISMIETAYLQRINQLIDLIVDAGIEPQVVNRVRRERDQPTPRQADLDDLSSSTSLVCLNVPYVDVQRSKVHRMGPGAAYEGQA